MQRISSPAEQEGWTRRDEWAAHLHHIRTRRESGIGANLCETCQKLLPSTNGTSVGGLRRHPGCQAKCVVCSEPYDGYGKSKYCSQQCLRHAQKIRRRIQRGREGVREGIGGAI